MEVDLNIEAIKEMLEAGRAEHSVESAKSPESSMDIDFNELITLPYEEEVRDHLQYLRQASEANPRAWEALHSRLARN